MPDIGDPGLPPKLSNDVNGRMNSFLIGLRAVAMAALKGSNGASPSSSAGSGDSNTARLPASVKREVDGRMYADPMRLLGYCVAKETGGKFRTGPNSVAVVVRNNSGQADIYQSAGSGLTGYVPTYWAALRAGETDTEEWKFKVSGDTLQAKGPST